jgi:penicillin-binding protein 2
MSATPMNRGELRNLYRFMVFALAVAVGVTSLGARMFYLQVVQGQEAYQGSDTSQSTPSEPVPSTRGLIFDAQGRPLVKNVVDYSVTVTPIDLPLDQEEVVAQKLGSVLNLDPVYIETTIDSTTGSLDVPVEIDDGISDRVARFIEENYDHLPGVAVVVTSKRQYLTKQLFAEIIGYEGQITQVQYDQLKALGYESYSTSDIVGQAGLENYYETTLRGTYGSQTVALDSSGKPIPGLVTPGKDPVPGDSLTLNIDSSEQRYAQEALQWGLTNSTSSYTKVTKGVIIVENPQNGKILAMVSLPSYDDQLFADGISATDFQALLSSPDQPLLNKAIGGQYPPGSTFKLVTGTAGLEDQPTCQISRLDSTVAGTSVPGPTDCDTGNFTDTTTLLSQPYVQFGDFKYWEWNLQGWGPLNINGGVANSSDTFFYQLAEMVGLDRLTYWADQYGFGRPTGIDLPETATGIVPTNSWKLANLGEPMYEGELMQAGIGQGYDAATPLQLLNAYCALANGGNLWQPQIVKSITDGSTGNVTDVQPVLINKLPASQQTLETMRLATRAVVTSRHTYDLVDLPIKVAGKTGTAEFGNPDANGVLPYHEWFVGYVPGDPYNGDFTKPDSQLAVVAFIYGADTWGNVATEVVKMFLMLHFHMIDVPAQALNPRTPGYIPSWVYRTTNFYGTPNRD